MDVMAKKVASIIDDTKVENVIVISPRNSMNILMKSVYMIKTFKEK